MLSATFGATNEFSCDSALDRSNCSAQNAAMQQLVSAFIRALNRFYTASAQFPVTSQITVKMTDALVGLVKGSGLSPSWGGAALVPKTLMPNLAKATEFLNNLANRRGGTEGDGPSKPSTTTTSGYKCSGAVCYAVNSPSWQKLFEGLQKNLNAYSGSAGFLPLKVDGIIGAGTMAAWAKAAAWLKTKGMSAAGLSTSSKEQLAINAAGINTLLASGIGLYSPAQAKPPGGYMPPPGGEVPPGDQAANDASKKSKWPYYVAAGAGALAILALALKLSTPRAALPPTT